MAVLELVDIGSAPCMSSVEVHPSEIDILSIVGIVIKYLQHVCAHLSTLKT